MKKKAPKLGAGAVVSVEEAQRIVDEHGEFINVSWGLGDRRWNAPQMEVLTSECDEIACLGGKGGGKTAAAIAWLVSGNPSTSESPWDQSYAFHPGYRGLILRRNQEDLDDFIKKAIQMYSPPPLGGEFVSRQFRFPSGAVIDCGHMKDKSSWQSMLGIEFQRIVIDEAALIPDFESYEQLRSCLRTTFPELRRQVLLTSNANGPGVAWITERFMNARKPDGTKYGPSEIIEEEYQDPISGEMFKQTRLWVFSTFRDNPAVIKTGYGRQLATISDSKMRRAYLDGDWFALFGSYFGDLWRPEGPASNEPTNANHVIPPTTMPPWWGRSISMDWGYSHESAVLWGAQDPDNRLIIYRELVGERMLPDRIGWEIARLSRDELERSPSHSMTLWLSHDAFHNDRGEKTIAELIEQGIGKVLGANAVHVPDIIIRRIKESYQSDVTNWSQDEERNAAIEAIRKQRNIGITIRIAPKNDVITWQHVRERMRWESSGQGNVQFEPEVAHRLLQVNPKGFEEYCRVYRDVKPEVLPKLQVTTDCPRLIAAIPRAMHEEGTEKIHKAHFLGHDSVDSLGYICSGINQEPDAEPFEAFRSRKMTEIVRQNPGMTTTDLVRTNIALEGHWQEQTQGYESFTPPSGARAMRMMRQGLLKAPETNVYGRI